MHGFLPIVRLGAHDGALRDWVISIKHNQWEAMGVELGKLLGAQVAKCQAEPLTRLNAVVVPVPMPWIRKLDRGIDHSACIASGVATALKLRCVQPLWQRAHHSQVTSGDRSARMGSRDRFAPRARWRAVLSRKAITDRTAIVVDDVRTTGATTAFVGAQLLSLGARQVIPAVLSVKE